MLNAAIRREKADRNSGGAWIPAKPLRSAAYCARLYLHIRIEQQYVLAARPLDALIAGFRVAIISAIGDQDDLWEFARHHLGAPIAGIVIHHDDLQWRVYRLTEQQAERRS